MTASVFKLNTANTTNLTSIKGNGLPCVLKGIEGTNTAAYAIFVKFYWYDPTTSAATPTVGTTVPDLTIPMPALATSSAPLRVHWQEGITNGGQLFMAVTKLASDSDTTVVVAGDGLISVFYE